MKTRLLLLAVSLVGILSFSSTAIRAQAYSNGCNPAHNHGYYLGSNFYTDTDYGQAEGSTSVYSTWANSKLGSGVLQQQRSQLL
jgi:hypothetical protein